MLFGFTRLELSGVAFRRETIDTVCPPLGFQFLFSNAGHIEHFLAGLAAHRRFPNKKGCKTADPAGRHVTPPNGEAIKITRPISGRWRKNSSRWKYSRVFGESGTSSGGRPKIF